MAILNGLFEQDFAAINVGLVSFRDGLQDAGFTCLQVDWQPPCGGDEELLAALASVMD